MVIVSQDKRVIINFENMKTIELDRETDFTSINIFRETNETETGVCGLFIGRYKTEERAKEVLKEIVRTYVLTEQYKVEDDRTKVKLIMEGVLLYEMPEE